MNVLWFGLIVERGLAVLHEFDDDGLEDAAFIRSVDNFIVSLLLLHLVHHLRGRIFIVESQVIKSHAIGVNQENPLVHLEVFDVKGRHQLYHFNANQLIQQMRP